MSRPTVTVDKRVSNESYIHASFISLLPVQLEARICDAIEVFSISPTDFNVIRVSDDGHLASFLYYPGLFDEPFSKLSIAALRDI